MLEDETWEHIREFHPEVTEIGMIEGVLLNPDWILRSVWDTQTYLYYQRVRPHRFGAVIVEMSEKRIKTTLTTDRIKEGEVIWQKSKPML